MNKKIKLLLAASVLYTVMILCSPLFSTNNAQATSSDNVYGFAWSENIGWISFNSTDTGGGAGYGVNMNTTSGNLSGYAWSENVGWMSFNAGDVSGCPYGSCSPSVDVDTGKVSGWAKILSLPGAGLDSWVSLSPQSGSSYGLTYNKTTSEFEGYAWSSSIGWISFNKKDAGAGGSTYAVHGPTIGGETSTTTIPTGLVASTTASCGGKVSLAWNSVTDATSYKIYRSATLAGTYTDIGTSTTNSYIDIAPATLTTYYYKVAAVSPLGVSDQSSESHAKSSDVCLVPPANLVVTTGALCGGNVHIAWDAVAGATSYKIWRSTSSFASGGSFVEITSAGGVTGTLYEDTDAALLPSTKYYYMMRSHNAGGDSAYTPDASGNSSAACTVPPGVPTNLTADMSPRCGNGVDLTWDVSPEADSFKIYRSISLNGVYDQVGTSVTNSYTDNAPNPSTTYYYKIKASNPIGDSAFSNGASAQSSVACVNPPTTITANTSGTCDSVDVAWTPAAGATSYKIYRSSTLAGTYSEITPAGGVPGRTYTDHDPSLSPSTVYYYIMRSHNAAGDSASTIGSPVSASTAGACGGSTVAPPTGLTASPGATCGGKISLTWNSEAAATGYRVYASSDAAGPFTDVTNPSSGFVAASGLVTYNDSSSLVPSTRYYYKVASYDALGTGTTTAVVSSLSSAACVVVPGNPRITTMKALPGIGNKGYACTINWTVTDAIASTRCSFTGPGVGAGYADFDPSNSTSPTSFVNTNVQTQSTYTLKCRDTATSAVNDVKTATCKLNVFFREF